MAFSDGVTGTASWPGFPIEVGANGEPYNNTNAKAMFQKYANGLAYLKRGETVGTIDCFGGVVEPAYTGGYWDKDDTATKPGAWIENDVAGVRAIMFPVPRPPAAFDRLTAFAVYLKGATGHSALPATMPTANVQHAAISNLASYSALMGGVSDPSGSVGAYEVQHTIPWSGSIAVDFDTDTYWVYVQGEASTNAIVGLEYWGFRLTFGYS